MGDNETDVASNLIKDNLYGFFIWFEAISSIYDE